MPAADLAILGAAVRTLDPGRPHASAIAVRDGLIVAVGEDAEVREHTGPQTELVDGRGMAVVPGGLDHIEPPAVTPPMAGAFKPRDPETLR